MPFRRALDHRTHRPQRRRGREYILAFEETGDLGTADRKRPKHQCTVRNRLVARHPDRTGQRPGRADTAARVRQRHIRAGGVVVRHLFTLGSAVTAPASLAGTAAAAHMRQPNAAPANIPDGYPGWSAPDDIPERYLCF